MLPLSFKAYLSRCKNIYLLLAVTFVLFIAWQNLPDFKMVLIHLQTVSVSVLSYGLLCAFSSYAFRSMRWLAYLRLVEMKASKTLHSLIYLSGFSFTASAVGVKGDEFISENGHNWDGSWNPIWYTKSHIDDQGWSCEMKIPLSQLRFSNEQDQVWGFQVQRRFFRKEEQP